MIEGGYFGMLSCMGCFEEFGRKEITELLKAKNRGCSKVVDSIIREVGSWLMVIKEFKELSLSMLTNNWVTGISIPFESTRCLWNRSLPWLVF